MADGQDASGSGFQNRTGAERRPERRALCLNPSAAPAPERCACTGREGGGRFEKNTCPLAVPERAALVPELDVRDPARSLDRRAPVRLYRT